MQTVSTSKLYICGICEESFSTKEHCREHAKTAHQPQKPVPPPPDVTTGSDTKTAGNKQTDKPEPTSADPSRHPAASQALAKFSDEEILAKLLERNGTFVCKCGVIFQDQTLFYLHRGTHSSKNPYECSFCGHVAPDWYDFTSHFYFHTSPPKDPKNCTAP